MMDDALYQAVERFAAVTQNLSADQLEHEWAWGAYDSEGVRFAFFRTYEELRQVAIQTARQRDDRQLGISSAQRALAGYHAAFRDLQALLLGISARDSERSPAAGQWSLRETAAHIVQADIGFYVVVKYALDRHRSAGGRPAEISDEAWDTIIGQDEALLRAMLAGPLPALQAYHVKLHRRVLTDFASISDGELDLPSRYWEGYDLSLQFRLLRFESHLRQHIIQIEKVLAGIKQPPSEAKRLLRLLYAALAQAEGAAIGAWEAGAGLRRAAGEKIMARADEIASILA